MTNESSSKKVLVMGKHGVGKTCMHKCIFGGADPNKLAKNPITVDIDQQEFNLAGSFPINIWDCGGQERYFSDYLTTRRQAVYSNVAMLVFVFEVDQVAGLSSDTADRNLFRQNLEALFEFSPEAKVVVLVSKMDTVSDMLGFQQTMDKMSFITKEDTQKVGFSNFDPQFHLMTTSYWDSSLRKSWSSISQMLLPNKVQLNTELQRLASEVKAKFMFLYDTKTMLELARVVVNPLERYSEQLVELRIGRPTVEVIRNFEVADSISSRLSNSFLSKRRTSAERANRSVFVGERLRTNYEVTLALPFTSDTVIYCIVPLSLDYEDSIEDIIDENVQVFSNLLQNIN